MRPRGLSNSSPSRRYVGHVAVQKPQCTQVRRIFSDDCIAGSLSCSGVKLVCMFFFASLLSPSGGDRAAGGDGIQIEIAKVLRAPLDLVLVRKIGAPGHPELGLGAV